MILASPSVIDRVLPACALDLQAEAVHTEKFRGECCEEELARIFDIVARDRVDVMVGMGGGKTIDTAKIVADRAGIPVIVVPTIASTDAPCSGCAVVYSKQGAFGSVLYQRTNPAAVLVDLDIIAAAPTRFLVAGMGDALSTWFEARSCHRTRSPNECGGISTDAGLQIAKLCYETLLTHGVAAKVANEDHIVTPAFDHIVEANILLERARVRKRWAGIGPLHPQWADRPGGDPRLLPWREGGLRGPRRAPAHRRLHGGIG